MIALNTKDDSVYFHLIHFLHRFTLVLNKMRQQKLLVKVIATKMTLKNPFHELQAAYIVSCAMFALSTTNV